MFIWKRFFFFLALIGVIFTASGTANLAAPDPGFRIDKPAHFFVFGLVATALLRSLSPALPLRTPGRILLTVLVVSCIGGLDEFRQSFTPGRFPEVADWIADTLGAVVATLVYSYWTTYRRILEWSFLKRKAPVRAVAP